MSWIRQYWAIALACLFTLVLYVGIGVTSAGYDDEVISINAVMAHPGWWDLITSVHEWDAHPAGMYVINKALYEVLGSWPLVRGVSGAVNAVAMCTAWLLFCRTTKFELFAGYVAICMSPTILIWATGLRWYAYFTPLLVVLMIITFKNLGGRKAHWAGFFAVGIALFYIEYVAALIVPVLAGVSLWIRRKDLRREWLWFLGFGAVCFFVCLPQLLLLFDGELQSAGGRAQTASPLVSVLGTGLDIFNGPGALPLSLAATLTALANVPLLFFFVRQLIKREKLDTNAVFYLVALGLMTATGLSGKFRNLVILAPARGVFQARLASAAPYRKVAVVAVGLLALGNGLSAYNIATHQNTFKGSWNTPYFKVNDVIAERTEGCKTPVVVGWDVVALHHAQKVMPNVVAAYDTNWAREVPNNWDCLVMMETAVGSLGVEKHDVFVAELKKLGKPASVDHIGKDAAVELKRKWGPIKNAATAKSILPAYYVTLNTFKRS